MRPETRPRPEAPARLWRRLAAMTYDGLLILAIWMLTLLLMVVANGGEAVFGAPVQSLLFLELVAFFAYFWCTGGQTAGMRAWQLRLVSDDGGSLSLNQAMLRLFGALAALAALGAGYLWALFDRQGRTWPDLLSHSRIVHQDRTSPESGLLDRLGVHFK